MKRFLLKQVASNASKQKTFTHLKNHVISILILLLLMFTTSVKAEDNNGQSTANTLQLECDFEITVQDENEQGMKDKSPVYFLIELKNTGTSPNTFEISAEDFNDFNENPGGSSTESNIDLDQIIEDADHNSLPTPITVQPGGIFQFYVKITALPDTDDGKWNGTKVLVKSSTCPDKTLDVILHTFTKVPKAWGCIPSIQPNYKLERTFSFISFCRTQNSIQS